MTRFCVLIVAVIALGLGMGCGQNGNSAGARSAAGASRPSATSQAVWPRKDLPPVPAGKSVTPEPREGKWLAVHESFVRRAARNADADVVFLGDSITAEFNVHSCAPDGQPFKAVNLGIAGDRTENVLWRIQNGELEGSKAKVVVLLIGTNNLGNNYGVDDAVAGIGEIIKAIQARCPTAKILLMGIFPRWNDAEFRQKIKQANARMAKYADGKAVRFLDIGEKFLEPDGTLSVQVAHDLTHLTRRGYQIWRDNMCPTLYEMLGIETTQDGR